jgi:hypothetical protein
VIGGATHDVYIDSLQNTAATFIDFGTLYQQLSILHQIETPQPCCGALDFFLSSWPHNLFVPPAKAQPQHIPLPSPQAAST